MPGGRPTKYKPEYCEMLIEHMGKGLSYEAFCSVAKVHVDTLYEWEKVHPKYSEAKKVAFADNRLFWEKLGIKGVTSKTPFNATVWIFNMKNRFGWRDKKDIEQTTNQESRLIINLK